MVYRVIGRKCLTVAVLVLRVCWREVNDSSIYVASCGLDGTD